MFTIFSVISYFRVIMIKCYTVCLNSKSLIIINRLKFNKRNIILQYVKSGVKLLWILYIEVSENIIKINKYLKITLYPFVNSFLKIKRIFNKSQYS